MKNFLMGLFLISLTSIASATPYELVDISIWVVHVGIHEDESMQTFPSSGAVHIFSFSADGDMLAWDSTQFKREHSFENFLIGNGGEVRIQPSMRHKIDGPFSRVETRVFVNSFGK